MTERQAKDALADLEDVVLTYMWERAQNSEFGPDGIAFGLRFFEPILPREVARGILRNLRDKGALVFMRGLWTEDGEPAGAGYALTWKTVCEFRALERERLNEERGRNTDAGKYAPHLIDQPFDSILRRLTMPTRVEQRRVTARKQHRCDECGTVIEIGEEYIDNVLKDGDVYHWRAHPDCQECAFAFDATQDFSFGDDRYPLIEDDYFLEELDKWEADFPKVVERIKQRRGQCSSVMK